jgi:hypothetical protein
LQFKFVVLLAKWVFEKVVGEEFLDQMFGFNPNHCEMDKGFGEDPRWALS